MSRHANAELRRLRRATRLLFCLAIPGYAACTSCERIDEGVPSCADCRITLDPVIRFGADANAMAPAYEAVITRKRSGELYVAPLETPGVIGVFDVQGKLIRSIGRTGDGPGEFRSINYISFLEGDTLVVADRVQSTLTFFAPNDSFVRRVSSHSLINKVLAAPGGGLVLAIQSNRADIGPLQIVTRDGATRRVFGRDDGESFERLSYRRIAFHPGGDLWAARTNEYRLDVYDLAGTLVRSVRRSVEWFPRLTHETLQSFADRPEPPQLTLLRDIVIDDAARIWVIIDCSNPAWRPPADQDPTRRLSVSDINARVRHVIEVLDTRTGGMIATRDFDDELLMGFLDERHVFGVRELTDGSLEAFIMEMRLLDAR